MKDTVFKNCNGLDEEGHYSSAYDVALMSAELIKHTKVFDYTSIWLDFLRDGKTQIVNTNKLLKSYNGITGLKTGTTSEAGSCISATARRDGMNLIAVSLGCDSTNERFKSASTMLDYGFNNFGIKVPEKVKIDKIKVNKGIYLHQCSFMHRNSMYFVTIEYVICYKKYCLRKYFLQTPVPDMLCRCCLSGQMNVLPDSAADLFFRQVSDIRRCSAAGNSFSVPADLHTT